jgi:hypothetical protein
MGCCKLKYPNNSVNLGQFPHSKFPATPQRFIRVLAIPLIFDLEGGKGFQLEREEVELRCMPIIQ